MEDVSLRVLYITFTHIVVIKSMFCSMLSLVFSSKAPALLVRYSMFCSPYHHWCRRCTNLNRQPITQTSNPHPTFSQAKSFLTTIEPRPFHSNIHLFNNPSLPTTTFTFFSLLQLCIKLLLFAFSCILFYNIPLLDYFFPPTQVFW